MKALKVFFLVVIGVLSTSAFAGERDYLEWAGVTEAQKTSKGHDVLIAVLNTGVNYNLPEFQNRIAREENGSFGFDSITGSHDPMDMHGLGTEVASVAAGNEFGVAPEALLVPVRIFDENGAGTFEGVARGVSYAVDRGVKILEIGGGPFNLEKNGRALCDALQRADAQGILTILSVGNSGTFVNAYPTGCELHNVVNVASVDSNGDLATYSNFGFPAVHLAAPAQNIWRKGWDGSTRKDGQGTSFSSPFAAGVAALVWAAHPEYKASDVKIALIRGAVERDSLRGKVLSNGFLHANLALEAGVSRK